MSEDFTARVGLETALAAAQARIAELETVVFAQNAALREVEKERDELENQLILTRAERDGIGSLLLDVQKDCIALRQELNQGGDHAD